MIDNYLFYFAFAILAFIIVLAATPIIARIAVKQNIIDRPGAHKTHQKPRPLLGGLAIFIGFAAVLLFFIGVDNRLLSLVAGTIVLLITGLFDDIYDIKPMSKLIGQTMAAVIVVLWNTNLYVFMIEYFASFYLPALVVLILIIGWIVLIINAFNLIDGLDGLAAGTAAIILAAMAVLSFMTGGNPNIFAVQLIALGACLGFLVYNFYPAKIFMGDTGSMMLGFILANVHLFTIKYPFNATLVLGSMFIFAYPALDLVYAIYRRLANRRSILHADRGHIHHILLSLGYSQRKTVITIYLVNIFFATIGVVLLGLNLPARLILIIGAAMLIFVTILFSRLQNISRHNGVH